MQRDTSSGRYRISDSSPISGAEAPTPPPAGTAATVSGVVPAASSTPSATVSQPSSGSSSIAIIAKEHKLSAATVMLIVLVLIGGSAYGLRGVFTHTTPRPFAQFSISQATNSGTATLAAISPDGKYLLFTKRENGLESLWLRNVPTSSDTQVVAPSPNTFASLSFSPDGNYLYFRQAGDKTGNYHLLFRAPVLGGTPKLLVRDVDAHPVFSPDAQRMVFVRCNNPESDKCRWLSANPDGTSEQVLLIRPGNGAPRQLSWSPDGKRIAFSAQATEAVNAFDVSTGKEVPLFSRPGNFVGGVEWASDGRGFVILHWDNESSYERGQIGFVSYPADKFEPLTNDTNNYTTLSLSADNRTLATIQSQLNGEIDTLLTSGSTFTGVSGLAKLIPQTRDVHWLSDTELLLILPTKILRVAVDGSKQTEIFNDTDVSLGAATVCQHGETIVVGVLRHQNGSRIQLWRMNLDGSNLKRITDGETDGFPVCSPGEKFFYYFDGKNSQHMKLSFDGSSPEVLSGVGVPKSEKSQIQTVSRDGRMLAVTGAAVDPSTSTYKTRLAVFESESTKSPMLLLDADPRFSASVFAQFTPDGKALTYVIRADNNVDNIWLQPLDGKAGRQITNFKSDEIYNFSYSPNGTNLLVTRGHVDSDVVLLRDTTK